MRTQGQFLCKKCVALAVSLLLGLPPHALADPGCPPSLRDLTSRLARSTGGRVREFVLPVERSAHVHAHLFPESPDGPAVSLGFNRDGHAYLIVGDLRFDGGIPLFGPPMRIRGPVVQNGTVVHFPSLSRVVRERLYARVQAIQARLARLDDLENQATLDGSPTLRNTAERAVISAQTQTFKCVHGACSILRAEGIHTRARLPLLDGQAAYNAVLGEGLVDPAGRPVTIEIYNVGYGTLEGTAEAMGFETRYFQRRAAPAIAFVIIAGTIVGMAVGVQVIPAESEEEERRH